MMLALVGAALAPASAAAQVEAEPTLSGRVFVADTALRTGTVVLHRISDLGQGELDSVRVAADGAFSFRLPRVPDPARDDVYFASVRHAGVLYFGHAVTLAAQLDSLYEIHTYDTLMAPPEGVDLVVQARNVFFEPDSSGWRVTDVFQLRNDRDRTLVARDGGRVWIYPLPAEARDPQPGQGELSLDPMSFEDGSIVVRAAVPPGERLFVIRYSVDDPFLSLPTPGRTEALDILVREPAPPLEAEGLALVGRVELEPGTTYRRFSADDLSLSTIRLREGEDRGAPPVRWIAVALALVLAAAGLFAFRGGGRLAPAAAGDRGALLLQVARLDEEFETSSAPSDAAFRTYERRRSELVRRLRALG
jgi:hypothetical protein